MSVLTSCDHKSSRVVGNCLVQVDIAHLDVGK